MSAPLALSDLQLAKLRQAAAMLPVQMRSGLLQLVAGYLELEGDITDASFRRALAFALDNLPPCARRERVRVQMKPDRR
jgi:hypothetical protein